MTLKLPNFFIIGAPKSGTTALYNTISQHAEIYMSPVKEPRFFAFEGKPRISPPARDFVLRMYNTVIWQPRNYLMLFAGISNQKAIGEASTIYLRTPLAAHRIKKNIPQSRIIALLRHPAERAYSHYSFIRQKDGENAFTFEQALACEEKRRQDGWYSGFHYKKNGYYHEQLSVYYKLFPKERISVYLYDDWKESPGAMLRDLFGFLGVDQDVMPEICLSNVTLLPRSRRIHRWAMASTRFDRSKPFLPLAAGRAVTNIIRKIDTGFNMAPPPPLDHATRARLTADYREDILKLQDLIGRDLSRWLKNTMA